MSPEDKLKNTAELETESMTEKFFIYCTVYKKLNIHRINLEITVNPVKLKNKIIL